MTSSAISQRAQEFLPDVFLQLGNDLRALVGVQQAVEVGITLERVEDVGHVLGVISPKVAANSTSLPDSI